MKQEIGRQFFSSVLGRGLEAGLLCTHYYKCGFEPEGSRGKRTVLAPAPFYPNFSCLTPPGRCLSLFFPLPAGNSRKYRPCASEEGVSLPKGDAKLSPSVVRLGSQSQPRPQPIFGLWRFFFVFPSAHLHVMLTQILQPGRRRGAARRGVEDACGGGGGGVGGGGWWPLAVAVSVVAAAHAARRE